MRLSPTLTTIAGMTRDEATYWGSEVYGRVGNRVYFAVKDLAWIPRPLITALGTVWKSLQFADDIR